LPQWTASAYTSTDFPSPRKVSHPPRLEELEQATAHQCGPILFMTGHFPCEHALPVGDFCAQMRTMSFSSDWGLQLQLVGSQRALHVELSAGQGFAVSDGSFKDTSGVTAWIIKGSSSQYRLIGQWHMPGHEDDHSSFCSKVTGIVGILFTLMFWPPTSASPTFRLACNGLSVIN